MHTTNTVLMIRPDHFGFNPQTAATNTFQHKPSLSEQEVQKQAMAEFELMVKTLQNNHVRVLVMPSRTDTITPDALFPNNWFSHHENNTFILYPMLAPNRRAERQILHLEKTLTKARLPAQTIIDMSSLEEQGKILEGTGSMVLDRTNKTAYAMRSPRTTDAAFSDWCKKLGYEKIFFHGPIYHTNMLMCIGEQFAVVCLDSIQENERDIVRQKLRATHKELIDITMDQVNHFSGNILQLRSTDNNSLIVMSTAAYEAFSPDQRTTLERHGKIVTVSIPTIESVGGGSARCMMAEIFTG